jgi:hypothetical protein
LPRQVLLRRNTRPTNNKFHKIITNLLNKLFYYIKALLIYINVSFKVSHLIINVKLITDISEPAILTIIFISLVFINDI